jgi:hypothetical protein
MDGLEVDDVTSIGQLPVLPEVPEQSLPLRVDSIKTMFVPERALATFIAPLVAETLVLVMVDSPTVMWEFRPSITCSVVEEPCVRVASLTTTVFFMLAEAELLIV